MKFLTPLVFCFCLFQNSKAQQVNFDHYIKSKYVPCDDVAGAAPEILLNFYQRDAQDSLVSFLNYWSDKCRDGNKYLFYVMTALKLADRTFITSEIDSIFFKQLINAQYTRSFSTWGRGSLSNAVNRKDLSQFVETIIENAPLTNRSQDEVFLIRFFGKERASISDLDNEEYKNARLSKLYHDLKKRLKNRLETGYAFGAGIYLPTGKSSIFGPKANISLLVGGRKKRNHLYARIGADFGKSKNSYLVQYQDSLIPTTDWLQVFLGADYNIDLLQYKRSSFQLLTGLGYSLLSVIDGGPEETDLEPSSRGSLNINAGLGIEKQFNGWILGIQGRYNYVNYKIHPGESDFGGHHINILLTIGMRNVSYRHYSPYHIL